jgi:serine/threonine protein kinase
MSEKIRPPHLARRAILYVRQSSPGQVLNNTESQRLQYAMRERLIALGWADIEVIDEDLGQSAAGTASRAGFERLVAAVCLGEVGAVAAREVSRFARNNREWQQRIEVCRMVDTLLIDHEAVYDPRAGNDRLLLGLKAAAKLLHPNIVPVYDAGRSGSVYYVASAFIKGMTLAPAVPEEGGMESGRAVKLTAQLATALGYAHKQGLLHRDVKPANAMVNEQESLHLMDFGLAGWTQEENTRLTRLGAVMGTPAYMAPEQASGDTKNVGPAADLYGTGVVLYELLTSRHPFEGGHPAALAYQIIHTVPTPPSQHKPDLDAALEAICLKAMAKRPEDCFASGEEMAAALAGWNPTAVAEAMPTPLARPAKPTARPTVSWEDMVVEEVVARPTPASHKETILPLSGRPAARRPSVFDRETVLPASAKHSTLGSPTAARTQGDSRQRQDAGSRRNLMLGGAVLLAAAGVLLFVMLIRLSSPKPPANTEQANNEEKRHTDPPVEPKPAEPTPPTEPAPTDERPAPPSKARVSVGRYVVPPQAGPTILVRRQADKPGWQRLATGAPVFATDDLVSLPGYQSELDLGPDGGAHLVLHGRVPEYSAHFAMDLLMESAVQLHDPEEGFDLDLTLDRGRFTCRIIRPKAWSKCACALPARFGI